LNETYPERNLRAQALTICRAGAEVSFGIDGLFRAEADREVFLRQVELGGAVVQKGDIACIALFSDACAAK
jgi:hypothetical protein